MSAKKSTADTPVSKPACMQLVKQQLADMGVTNLRVGFKSLGDKVPDHDLPALFTTVKYPFGTSTRVREYCCILLMLPKVRPYPFEVTRLPERTRENPFPKAPIMDVVQNVDDLKASFAAALAQPRTAKFIRTRSNT